MTVFDDPNARRVFTAEIVPYDTATSATTTLYVSTEGFTTASGDTPADTYFVPILSNQLVFQRSMYRPGAVGGRSLPGRGNLVLVNTGDYDDWLDLHFDGRQVTIKAGVSGDDYSTFQTVFEGFCGEAGFGRNEIQLPLIDKREKLDTVLQATLFAGTGGVEGGDDLKSKPKPLCFGKCQNITPLLVDATNRIYQVNDGQIEAIDAVYDNGKLLTLTTNYTVDLTNGRFTLVAAATGLITADVRGDKDGGTYVSSAADIVKRLVVGFGGLLDPGDLDTASFSALNTKTTAVLGVYSGTGARNLTDVLDELIGSIGGFYGFTRLGKFSLGRLETPGASADLDLTEADLIRDSVSRESFGPPAWRRRLGYGRAWSVQSPDQLDAAASAAFKSFVGEQFRVASDEDTAVKEDGVGKGGFRNAIDPEPLATLLVEKADAEAEATRRLTLYKTRRENFHVSAKTQPFAIDMGDVVNLTHSRFGLSGGKDLIVVGFEEFAALGEINLDLWG